MTARHAVRGAVVVTAAAVAAGCGPTTPAEIAAAADTVAEGVLTACVAPTPRLVQPDGEGGFEGYDVDALRHVAGYLELELELVETTFDDVVAGDAVNAGRCDVGAGGVVLDGDVATLVETTRPYREVDRLVVAPPDVAERAGGAIDELVVGVEGGGPAADAVPALAAEEVVAYPSRADLLRALGVRDVDAVLVTAQAVGVVEEEVGEVVLVATVPTGDREVMVLPRGTDEALVAVLDEALTDFVAEEADAAADRWLRR